MNKTARLFKGKAYCEHWNEVTFDCGGCKLKREKLMSRVENV